jgi:hypothetical protein
MTVTDLLWEAGDAEGAIRLEALWNALASTRKFSLLCGYATERFTMADRRVGFDNVCSRHTHVLDADDLACPIGR